MRENAPDTEKNLPGPEGPVNREPARHPRQHRNKPRRFVKARRRGLPKRATALRGQGIGRPPAPKSAVRRQTQGDIFGKDPEIPYVKFEAAARDLVCSLMERQDRMNEEIFYRINDLAYRLDDLEEDRQENGGG